MTQYILAYKQNRSNLITLPRNLSSIAGGKTFIFLTIEIAVLFILGILYIIYANNLALSGQKIHNLEKRLSEINTNNLRLNIQLNNLKSSQNLYSFSKSKNLIDIKKLTYINEDSSYLVKK